MTLTIYVPKEHSSRRFTIQQGSAIVGRPATLGGHIEVSYEGDIYGFLADDAKRQGIEPFFWWMYHAADRLESNYPTSARCWLPEEELVPVGFYDRDSRDAVIIDEDALEKWRTA